MLGTFGSGGVLLVIIVALAVHKRGGGKFKPVKDHHVFYWGCAISLVAASAGEAFRQVSTVSSTFSAAFSQQSGTLGAVGPAAIAAVLLLIVFGFRPAFTKDLLCGVAAPGILAAAGGVWALPMTVLGSFLHSVVG